MIREYDDVVKHAVVLDLSFILSSPSEILVGGTEDKFAPAVVDADFESVDGLLEYFGDGEVVVEAAAVDRGDGVGQVQVGLAGLHLVGGRPVALSLRGGHPVEAGPCYGNLLRRLAGVPEVFRHFRDSRQFCIQSFAKIVRETFNVQGGVGNGQVESDDAVASGRALQGEFARQLVHADGFILVHRKAVQEIAVAFANVFFDESLIFWVDGQEKGEGAVAVGGGQELCERQ